MSEPRSLTVLVASPFEPELVDDLRAHAPSGVTVVHEPALLPQARWPSDHDGVPPELVPDFIALRGDPSDGLPGAKGVGEKTAAELLRKHGSLEAVLENAIREPREGLRLALTGAHDDLLAFKEIATLQPARIRRPRDKRTDWKSAAKAARERGMNRLAERLEERRAA